MSIQGVVLSAGGYRGYIHLGVLSVLLKEVDPKEIRLWAGTSIGALISFLMALGAAPEKIMEYLDCVGEPQFRLSFDPRILVTKFGLIDMQQLVDVIEDLFIFCKMDKDCLRWSFEELLARTGKHLLVCSVDLDKGQAVYFSPFSTPELCCMDGVLASCCIPGIFQARTIDGHVHIDGGRLDRFPRTKAQNYLADITLSGENLGLVFGVMLQKMTTGPVTNVFAFLYKILTVGTIPESTDEPHVLFVDDADCKDKIVLYTKGMRACQKYFS
jgi:predicted acylesterase/phospholipase RssA